MDINYLPISSLKKMIKLVDVNSNGDLIKMYDSIIEK